MDSDYVTPHQKKNIALSTTQLLPWPVLLFQAVHSSQKQWAVNIVSGQTFGSMVSLEVLKGYWSSLRVLEYLHCWIFRSLKSFGWSASGFDSWHYWYKYSDDKSIGTSILHVHCIAFYPGLLLISQVPYNIVPNVSPMILSNIRALFSTEECKFITLSLLYWFFYIYI